MSLKHTHSLRQQPTVSPQLVMKNQVLQFSSLELEQAIAHELAENPALELNEVRRCRHCGSEMSDGHCPSCGAADVDLGEEWEDQLYVDSAREHSWAESGTPEGWDDPMSRLASRTTLVDHLLRQARLNLPADDIVIVAHLLDDLDERGYLRRDPEDVADGIDVQPERVERVLTVIQSLEPVGIAARDARQCLLIQMEHLRQDGIEHSLAEILVERYWDLLVRYAPSSVAKKVGTSVDDVCEALCFIRDNLNPYPAHAFWASPHDSPPQDDTVCPEPDIIIRESRSVRGGYEIELPKARKNKLRVSPGYRQAMDELGASGGPPDQRGGQRWREFYARARLFVNSVEQRWRTLYELMSCLVDCQRAFLANGETELRPLTRARVAEMMEVHESTVSRAVAGKHVQLPCGEVVPLEKFFDDAAPIKRMIEDLVDQEGEPLSDGKIAERLSEKGYDLARRTVAKYRNALGILPYSLRRRRKDLSS